MLFSPRASRFAAVLAAFYVIVFFNGCASGKTAAGTPVPSATQAVETAIEPVKDERALTELKKMGDALASAKSMSFEVRSMTPLKGPNDQWVHVFSEAEVKMSRPDKLSIKTGGDAFPQEISYDGKMFSLNAMEAKLYTQEKMSGPIDSALAQAAHDGGVVFPFSDVLLANPYESWTNDLRGAMYVGESLRKGEKLQHVALTTSTSDWEFWTDEKTHLPRMVYVKYTGTHHSPSVLIEFSKWKTNGKIASSAFQFSPPHDSKKAEFKAPEGAHQ